LRETANSQEPSDFPPVAPKSSQTALLYLINASPESSVFPSKNSPSQSPKSKIFVKFPKFPHFWPKFPQFEIDFPREASLF